MGQPIQNVPPNTMQFCYFGGFERITLNGLFSQLLKASHGLPEHLNCVDDHSCRQEADGNDHVNKVDVGKKAQIHFC
jgi:hypothetical protein